MSILSFLEAESIKPISRKSPATLQFLKAGDKYLGQFWFVQQALSRSLAFSPKSLLSSLLPAYEHLLPLSLAKTLVRLSVAFASKSQQASEQRQAKKRNSLAVCKAQNLRRMQQQFSQQVRQLLSLIRSLLSFARWLARWSASLPPLASREELAFSGRKTEQRRDSTFGQVTRNGRSAAAALCPT